jgi:hypothetical protein
MFWVLGLFLCSGCWDYFYVLGVGIIFMFWVLGLFLCSGCWDYLNGMFGVLHIFFQQYRGERIS